MPDAEVVISGIAGTFPECLSVKELEKKVFNNENLVTVDDVKWKAGALNVPPHLGKMKEPFCFDQTFFGIHRRLCVVMDTHAKHSIEKTFEAIADAGINPHELYGSKVAVLMTSMTSETEYGSVMVSKTSGHAMLGHSRCMQSNRISYFFNFKGPSLALDSSWVGPIQVLEIAKNLVAKGHVKLAVVGASNMIFNPEVSVHYDGLRKLNSDGKTKSFSGDADGYSRSEGVVVFVVQRASEALRSYGSIVKVLCATQMNYKAVFPDQVGFNTFLHNFYSDLPIDKSEIGYVEGDGSASLAVDALELNGLSEVLCPGRKKPLLVGSVKSKVGHAESSAGFISVANALIALKTGYIPATINYSLPNPLVPAVKDGRIKIVTEKVPFEGEYVAVTSMGLASIYAHILIKKNPRNGVVKDASYFPEDGIPRVFLMSGRDEAAMKDILKEVETVPVDENFYHLSHTLFRTNFPKHLFRGYSINGEGKKESAVVSYPGGSKRPVWYIFSGMGSQWNQMGVGLMKIPVVRKAIEKCHQTLLPKGIDLINLITSTDPTVYDNILHAFVGIAAIQIGLVDLLESIGIKPDGVVGHSVGELGCSYGDKCLTAEQVILAAYARGKASNEADLIVGMMAAVGKSYAQIKNELPEGIEVACHNSKHSCTLSGPKDIMEQYVAELKAKGVFARLVNVANIAYHSKNIAPAAPYLLKYLKEIIPEPKLRTKKWISSSVPESDWKTDLAKYCSAEYHTNNLLSSVLFEEATAHVPADAICIEIAPHGLLQAIVKKSLVTCSHVPLTNRTKGEGCFFLMEALAKLYIIGVEMDLSKLYPPVDYPVPRETEYLSAITWDHSETWVPLSLQFEVAPRNPNISWKDVNVYSYQDDTLNYPVNHSVRGDAIYPKSKLLSYMMEFVGEKAENNSIPFKCYNFQQLKFVQDLPFEKGTDAKVQLLHQIGTGNFEGLLNEATVVTGQLNLINTNIPPPIINHDIYKNSTKKVFINENQIYEYFEGNNCLFKGPFRNLSGITLYDQGFIGKIKWRGSPEFFIESLFKLISFYSSIENDKLMDVESIDTLMYDPSNLPDHDQDFDIYYDKVLGIIETDAAKIFFYKTKPCTHNKEEGMDVKNRSFMPYSSVDIKMDFIELLLQIINENAPMEKIDLQLIVDETSDKCAEIVERLNSGSASTNYKINMRFRTTISDVSPTKETNSFYLVIAENARYEIVNTLLGSTLPFYFISCGDENQLKSKVDCKSLTLIMQQEKSQKGNKITLYKKRKTSFEDVHFIQLTTENFQKEVTSIKDEKTNKTYFLIYKYKMLSDISTILQTLQETNLINKRFLFIDESSPQFDPSKQFYKDQLAKDLKINIAFRGVWGSLRDKPISLNIMSPDIITSKDLPLNNIRCKNVDLKVIGINLQSLITPSKYKKIGVVEFSGVMNKKEVFGLGKITEDNYLEIDSNLCWDKPQDWTWEEAASVPFYYSMAYSLIYLHGKYSNRPYDSLLIHAGHTPFSQAVINVAVGLNILIYTTCFTMKQKLSIMKAYPQIKEANIYVLNRENRLSFVDEILESTEGGGVKIVVDALENAELRRHTLHCTGDMGQYILVTNNDMDSEQSFGMSIFFKETALFGYNPELIFDMKLEDKLKIDGLLQAGINTRTVRPLYSYCITKNVTRETAADIVIAKCKEELPVKVLLPVEKVLNRQSESETTTKEVMDKKHYMIVGAYNSLWFDLLKWLVSRGADCIYVVLNQDEMSQYIRKRFNSFVAKHKYISVVFNGVENLNTAQNCNQFIKKFQNGNSIDTVFYIKPGFEKQMTNMDYALRMHSKKSCLVSLGSQACRVTEKRRNDGFRGISFILMKNNLRSTMIISVLDNWRQKGNDNDDVILVDRAKVTDDNQIQNSYSDILPADGIELLDLCNFTKENARFVEMSTRCTPNLFTKELNPIFIFPGFKLTKMENFISKLLYPTFMARYPLKIKSINELASIFAETLVKNFDYEMYTLIAEGWAGPLALTVAKLLEEKGKISEVVLLEGAPATINKWSSDTERSNSVLSKYMPSIKENEVVTINDLKSWSEKMSVTISKEEDEHFSPQEIQLGLEAMINRLEVLRHFSSSNLKLKSTIHLFSTDSEEDDFNDLKQISDTAHHHIVDNVTDSFLESQSLVFDVCNLALLEYKTAAKKQSVEAIGTLDLILDAKYNTAGLFRR